MQILVWSQSVNYMVKGKANNIEQQSQRPANEMPQGYSCIIHQETNRGEYGVRPIMVRSEFINPTFAGKRHYTHFTFLTLEPVLGNSPLSLDTRHKFATPGFPQVHILSTSPNSEDEQLGDGRAGCPGHLLRRRKTLQCLYVTSEDSNYGKKCEVKQNLQFLISSY